jgi:lipopolysaccharide export system protein LptA
MNKILLITSCLFLFLHVDSARAADAPATAPASAKPASGSPVSHDQPIEVSSDKLDVLQNDHKAIFTGNVIAVQGTSTLRAAQMTVYYADNSTKPPPGSPPGTKKPKDPDAPQGITRIDAKDNVVFTTPTETAQGDFGTYDVAANTIDLVGKTVTLTRDKDVLKGTKLHYNMDTGQSVLTAGDGGNTDITGIAHQPARVLGLFVPKSDNKKPDAATAPVTATPQTTKTDTP